MIIEIYSRRLKRLQGGFPDVYQYETIPGPLRHQIIYIFEYFFRNFYEEFYLDDIDYGLYDKRDGDARDYEDDLYGEDYIYKKIIFILCREYGLPEEVRRSYHKITDPYITGLPFYRTFWT